MRRSRVMIVAGVLAAVAVGATASVYVVQRDEPNAGPSRTTCPLGSDAVRSATSQTLAGLDRGIFSSFRVLEPPPPPLTSDHYHGPLWTYATIAGSRDVRTHDMTGEWEARLATGAIAERCSLGLTELQKAVAGGSVHYATGTHRFEDSGSGYARSGQVFAAQASGESDAEIVSQAKHVLGDYGLTPVTVRVLHPLGPALLVEASTDDVGSISGKVPEIENALDGGRWGKDPRFEGLYLALDGPDGPLIRSGATSRDAGGFGWTTPGFDSGIQHG